MSVPSLKIHDFRKDGILTGRLLVQPESLPETEKYAMPEQKMHKDVPTTSRVIEVSSAAAHIPKGALILHSRHAGSAFTHNHEKYLVINIDEVYAEFTELKTEV
jgi:co-chaperonin GroES (HSP10)